MRVLVLARECVDAFVSVCVCVYWRVCGRMWVLVWVGACVFVCGRMCVCWYV